MSNFCSHCGHQVSPTAQSCPSCGHVLNPVTSQAPNGVQKSKLAACLLAFCFGGLGVHRFYLRDYWIGATILALGLIGAFGQVPELLVILVIVVWIDFIVLLFRKKEYFFKPDGDGK